MLTLHCKDVRQKLTFASAPFSHPETMKVHKTVISPVGPSLCRKMEFYDLLCQTKRDDGQGMWHAWEQSEIRAKCSSKNLKGRLSMVGTVI